MRARLAAVAGGAAMMLAAGSCAPGDDSNTQAETTEELVGSGAGAECVIDAPVKVGAVLSLTEGAAFAGEYQREGLQLAFDELNEQGGVEYELIEEDDKTDLEESIAVTEKLTERDQVSVLIGPTLSDMAFSTYEDTQQAGLPTVGISTTAEGIPEIGDYIFRVSLPEELALAASLPAAQDAIGLDRVAVLHDGEDEFTSSAYSTINGVLDDLGVEVVADESFETGDSEFRSQLTKVRESDPDALVLSALPAATVPLVKQARELGVEAPIVGGNAFNSPVMIANLEDAAEGLIVGGAWSSAVDNEGNAEFIEAYTEAYDRAPDQFAAQAYTAAQLVDTAVRADCDANRESIKDNLGQLEAQDTILGTLSIEKNGDVEHDPVVQIIENGEFTLFDD